MFSLKKGLQRVKMEYTKFLTKREMEKKLKSPEKMESDREERAAQAQLASEINATIKLIELRETRNIRDPKYSALSLLDYYRKLVESRNKSPEETNKFVKDMILRLRVYTGIHPENLIQTPDKYLETVDRLSKFKNSEEFLGELERIKSEERELYSREYCKNIAKAMFGHNLNALSLSGILSSATREIVKDITFGEKPQTKLEKQMLVKRKEAVRKYFATVIARIYYLKEKERLNLNHISNMIEQNSLLRENDSIDKRIYEFLLTGNIIGYFSTSKSKDNVAKGF